MTGVLEDTAHWEAALNNVENLQKAFAPAGVEIEVVHGDALPLLQTSNTADVVREQEERARQDSADDQCGFLLHDVSSFFDYTEALEERR